MIALYYGFWQYWQLYHKVTFDGVNRLIIINDGVTSIDVQRDIYSSWKEWVRYPGNAKWYSALSTVGGEPTILGQKLDVTYFLINGWKIKPYSGSYTLNLIGNIFDVDGGSIKVDADIVENNPNNITINTNTSVIVRQVDSGTSTGGLEGDERTALFNIENRVISIESLLQSPVSASLVPDQEAALIDIQDKMRDLWRVHGLDISEPMAVSKTGRLVADIDQDFTESGDTVIVTRN